jgi:hemerythrin-like domain-containing protein
MNAIELLKADHEKVSEIFEKLEDTTESDEKTRTELFTKLKQELDLHAHIEETIFYPVLKKAEETRDITMEGIQEHHVVKVLLGELNSMKAGSEVWTAKLKVLQENVEHHVEEEEDDMFKSARQVLSKERLEELGALMEQEKQQKPLSAWAITHASHIYQRRARREHRARFFIHAAASICRAKPSRTASASPMMSKRPSPLRVARV